MKKNLIVSSADNKYSKLLIELYLSLKKLDNYDFAILDCGLSKSDQDYFQNLNIQIKKPIWEYPLPKLKVRGREYLKVQFSRFFLHNYFPDYENYFWMDSDIWINCPETFHYYLKGVNEKGFSICPQIDRSSPKLLNIKWFLNFPFKINSINYKNISKSVSKKMGKKYAGYYTLNAGCFGYSKNYDGLSVIHKNLKKASKKGRIFGSDQVALALSLFEDNLEFEFLPSYCNWICEHHMPKYCESKEVFVEPYVPHHNIALIHLAGLDAERQNSNIKHEILTLSGKKIKKSLRYQN
mgnify:CR=1 FL=1